jgi:hypothetical protein
MLRLALALSLLTSVGCRMSLDDDDDGTSDDTDSDDMPIDAPISMACMEATTYQNLANIEAKIFKQSCVFSGCHNGANTDAGRLDLREGMAFADLVGIDSQISPDHKMVAPGDPKASYLLVIMQHVPLAEATPPAEVPPASVGYMPQGTAGVPLCVQKREAIERWIMAGALND